MFPHYDGLITALIKLRQAEIRREFERYHGSPALSMTRVKRQNSSGGLDKYSS